ncbi:MAG: hypothetical protein J5867_11650 [Prevotella sp.]|nr:hypothetical protein [Prevotella sp.]
MNIVGTFINNGEFRDIHDVSEVNMGTPGEAKTESSMQSPVHLNSTTGTKIDFIRVMNTLYELGFFTNERGGRITKKDFFTNIGQAVNIDLSKYDKDLSRSTADSTALDKHLRVFENMRQKMIDIFNSK